MQARLPGPLAGLTFCATAVGLRCGELPDIVDAAQEALLIAALSPEYRSALVVLDPDRAAEIVAAHGWGRDQARTIGRKLYQHSRAAPGQD